MKPWPSCRRIVFKPQVLAFAIVLVVACNASDAADSGAIIQRDSAGIVIVENNLARLDTRCLIDSTSEVTIGVAEGDEEYQLHRLFGARRLSDGTIALVNQGSQQVRFYDQMGQFIDQTGSEGEGPGEFRGAFQIWVLPGDTIWVGDMRPWRFLIFGPDRQWIRTVQPEPMYVNPPGLMTVLDDGRSVLADRTLQAQPGTNFEMTYLDVLLHGPDGSLMDTVGTYPNGRWGRMANDPRAMIVRPLFEASARMTSTRSHVVLGHTSKPEFSLLEVTDEARTVRIVRWTTEDRTISSADIEAERQRVLDQYGEMSAAMRRRYAAPLISEDRPVADQLPAFASMVAGRDGRIWIRDYPRPGTQGPRRWLAFDSEGRFQCSATIPKYDEYIEFGADYVLLKDHDDLGVEVVKQFRLRTPGG